MSAKSGAEGNRSSVINVLTSTTGGILIAHNFQLVLKLQEVQYPNERTT